MAEEIEESNLVEDFKEIIATDDTLRIRRVPE